MKAKNDATDSNGSNKELKIKLATSALYYHLHQKDTLYEQIAISGLAMYLKSHGQKSSAKLIAQIALAVYLQDEPGAILKPPKTYKAIAPINSAWSSKILMMRQLPTR